MLLSLCLVLGILFRTFEDDEQALPPEIATEPPDPPAFNKSCQTDPADAAPDTAPPPTYCHRSMQTDVPDKQDGPSLRHVACQTDASDSSTPVLRVDKPTQTDCVAPSVIATTPKGPKVVYCDRQTQTLHKDNQELRVEEHVGHQGSVKDMSVEPGRDTPEKPSPNADLPSSAEGPDLASTVVPAVTEEGLQADQSGPDLGQPQAGRRKWRPRGKKGKGKAKRELAAIMEEQSKGTVRQNAHAVRYDTSNVVLPRAWVRPARRHSITETVPFRFLQLEDGQHTAQGLRRASSATDLTCLAFGYTVTRPGSEKDNLITKRAIGITASASFPTGLSSRYELGSLEISALVAPF